MSTDTPCNSTSNNADTTPALGKLKRMLPLGVIALAAVVVFAFDLDSYLSFTALRENRTMLVSFVESHSLVSALLFVTVYAASTALSLPGAIWLTISSGFLFGTTLGTLYAVVGATIGATGIFLIARTAFGDILRKKARSSLARMEKGFGENAFSYLLVLRLIPLFPFFLVNLVPAFLGVPLRTYMLATFVGIIPGGFVYANVGSGLGSILDTSGVFSIRGILTPDIVTALVGLAILALLPVVYKKLKTRRLAA